MNRLKVFLTRNTIVPIFVVFFLGFSLFVPQFFTVTSLTTILNSNAYKGIMAIGMTFVIINGYFDMSVCTSMALTALLACKLQPMCGVFGAVLIALLVGLLVGCINGFFVAYMNINAFVVTLATMLGCRGIELIYAHNVAVASAAFRAWGASRLGYFTYHPSVPHYAGMRPNGPQIYRARAEYLRVRRKQTLRVQRRNQRQADNFHQLRNLRLYGRIGRRGVRDAKRRVRPGVRLA